MACDDDGVNREPESILTKRVIKDGEDAISQVLIQWKGQSMEDATWEEEFYVKSQFLHMSLEDKASLAEVGIDRARDVGLNTGSRPKVWRVYERRTKGVKRSAEVAKDVTESLKK